MSSDCSISLAGPAVESGGPGLATSTTGQSGAENSFALSVARLVESLPLSTPPGATSRILPGPIIAAGFARPPSALVKGLRLGLAAIGVGGVVLLLVMA